KEEVRVARIAMVIIAIVAGIIAYLQITNPVIGAYVAKTVGWAFAFAAATLSPAIILGIFWKRTTKEAAIIGMLVGLAVTLPYVIGVELGFIQPVEVLGSKIGSIAWGVVGFFANLIVTIIVSLLTPPPPEHIRKLVEDIRKP
ncbi:MAG TPA: cation acetate symporter, partial [Pyrodictium sp.]|nr:cation acetate symporter [Pyrodictium sp.]